MKSVIPFCVLLALLIFVEAFFFGYIALSYSRRVSEVKVTEQFLATNILIGVSNFLASVYDFVESTSNPESSVMDDSTSAPDVCFVDDLVVWYSPVSGYRCKLRGSDFYVGDYTPYGLIVKISSGRVYCSKPSGNFAILRPSALSGPPRQRRPGSAEGDGEDAPL